MNFAQPGWLAALLLLPFLVLGSILASRLRKRQWSVFAAPRLQQALTKRSSSLPRWLSLFLLLAACATAVIALARPRGDAGTQVEKTLGRNVMIALDLSKSMRVADVKPDRLTQAKVAIYELLDAMPNERIGLIGFAGQSYVYAPLTIDHSAVRETTDQIDENWVPLGGSNLSAAVHLATETLKKTGQKNNALVILSDGEEHDGNLATMISEAERSGVYIVAIGVGTENGDYVPNKSSQDGRMFDKDGNNVISRLQPGVMRKLAEGTRGRFLIAGAGQDIPAMVKSLVSGLDAFEMDARERRVFIELYQWLVFPTILLLVASIILGTRWRGVQAALLLGGFFLTTSPTQAGEASQAKAELSGKMDAANQTKAQEHYHQLAEKTHSASQQAGYHFGEATAAYRAKDYLTARTAFSQALLATDSNLLAGSHTGLGNCLFQLGWKALATDSYPTAPEALPDLEKFDALVDELLAKMLKAEVPEDGETSGFTLFDSIITNWADAIHHYDSVLKFSPSNPVALKNRELTFTYLKRLEKKLDDQKKQAEQAMPRPGGDKPGDGPPGDGEEGKDGKKGKGKNGGKQPNKGKKGEKGPDGEKPEQKDQKANDSGGNNPNETPEERALRILKENSDLEKGPISPGQIEYNDAEQDW